jgi:hypothetical protein
MEGTEDPYYEGDGAYDGYEDEGGNDVARHAQDIDFDDQKIASLPRVLLMGPRRGGKTSIQVRQIG